MKKKIICFLLVFSGIMTTTGMFARGEYIIINTGYGLSVSSQNIGTSTYTNDGSNTTTYNQEDFSFGKGFNFGGAVGYMLNKNIGAELGFSYLSSDKTTFNSSSVNGTDVLDLSSGMFRINPTIVIVSGMNGINPYAKFGVIIGSGFINEKDKYTTTGNTSMSTLKLNGGNAVGVTAGLGVKYKLMGKISLFGELNMVNMSYAPTKGEITAYSLNGTDVLASLKTNQRLTNFLKSYTVTSNEPASDTEPGKSLLQKFPFGSFGLNIGVIYNL